MKYPDLNSANSYLFTLEWRKYFWVFDLFGSFISYLRRTSTSSRTAGLVSTLVRVLWTFDHKFHDTQGPWAKDEKE